MLDFVYAQPVKILFGAGKFAELGALLAELGVERAVLVCGRHFASEADRLCREDARFAAVYSQVEQNPQMSGVEETVRLARDCEAGAIVGIGGGSAMDTAKFAAAVAPNEGEALDYYRGERVFEKPSLKIVCVPTTAGTGSEVTMVSVVSHGDEKRSVHSPFFTPTAALVDPLLTRSVPPRTTMNTGLDALCHAVEGYWSRNHQPIAELFSFEAVRLILENLERAYRDGSDAEAREKLSYASLLAGLAFAQPKTAACHACSYPLSERFHLPHGEACAFTFDSLVRLNTDERLDTLARRAGLRDSEELAEKIAYFKRLGGLRTRLSELEGDKNLDTLAAECAAHPLMGNNPRHLSVEELKHMFEALQ